MAEVPSPPSIAVLPLCGFLPIFGHYYHRSRGVTVWFYHHYLFLVGCGYIGLTGIRCFLASVSEQGLYCLATYGFVGPRRQGFVVSESTSNP